MHARSRWGSVAAGIGLALVLGGCAESVPTSALNNAATSPPTPTLVACDSISIRDVDTVPGDWIVAESVLIRGEAGARYTVTLPSARAATVTLDDSTEAGTAQTWRSSGLTVRHATVTTDPATDLNPRTLVEAMGPSETGLLSLTNADQGGFSGQLEGEVGHGDAVAYRGARTVAVAFAGDCSSPTGDPVPVTGSATLFDLAESGVLDCAQSAEPSSLAESAAAACAGEEPSAVR